MVIAPHAPAQELAVERRAIRGLSFIGNHAIDDYSLSISIATSNSSWLSRTGLVRWVGLGQTRYFDEREFRRDVLRLKLLYNQSGYLEARVDTIVRRSADAVSIRFLVQEGEPVVVTALDVFGTEEFPGIGVLERDLPLAVGDPFNRFLLQASTDSILGALRNRGYPFAQVFRSFTMDREARAATVTFEVDPGPRATVAAVRIEGGGAISEDVIRRMIPVRAGNVFRQVDLYDAQRELYGMNAFTYVNVRLEDSLPETPSDSTVSVVVALTPGSLHRVRLGGGYGSVDCFRGVAGWTAGNFLGGARSLDLTVRVSKIGSGSPFAWGLQRNFCFGLRSEEDSSRLDLNYNVTASLREPFVFSRRTSATLSVFGEKRSELNAYLRVAVGGEIALTRQTPWNVPVTMSYSLQSGRTEAEPAIFCALLNVCRPDDIAFTRPLRRAWLGLRATRDRANSLLDPTRGSRMSADVRWAATAIGADTLAQFTRAVGEVAAYHRVSRRMVFAWRLRAGTLVSSQLGLQGQNERFVPPDERFYAGGPNSVRGVGQNQLGPQVRVVEPDPRDTNATVTMVDEAGARQTFAGRLRTSPTGGNQMFLANAELRFPLKGRLTGAVFVDAGQVFNRGNELINLSRMRITPGAGVRLGSPLGPVRLDVAINPYAPTPGRLYRTEGPELILVADNLRPVRGSGLLNRLQLHLSVGQAY